MEYTEQKWEKIETKKWYKYDNTKIELRTNKYYVNII